MESVKIMVSNINNIKLSNQAIKRMFKAEKTSGIVNFGNAVLRKNSKIDFFFSGRNSFETKNQERIGGYSQAIMNLLSNENNKNEFKKILEATSSQENRITANIKVDDKRTIVFIYGPTEQRLVVYLKRSTLGVTTHDKLYINTDCSDINQDKLIKHINHLNNSGNQFGLFGGKDIMKVAATAPQIETRFASKATDKANMTADNTIVTINHGSGRTEKRSDKLIFSQMKDLLVGFNDAIKIIHNYGVGMRLAFGFDENVRESSKELLKEIINKQNKGQDTIYLTLAGFSRGSAITNASYNLVMLYLKDGKDRDSIPREMRKLLDSVALGVAMKGGGASKLVAKSNGDTTFITDILDLDQVRGPIGTPVWGKYAKYTTFIEAPAGKESLTRLEIISSSAEDQGGIQRYFFESSHIVAHPDVEVRVHIADVSHNNLDRDVSENTALNTIKEHFLTHDQQRVAKANITKKRNNTADYIKNKVSNTPQQLPLLDDYEALVQKSDYKVILEALIKNSTPQDGEIKKIQEKFNKLPSNVKLGKILDVFSDLPVIKNSNNLDAEQGNNRDDNNPLQHSDELTSQRSIAQTKPKSSRPPRLTSHRDIVKRFYESAETSIRA